MTNDDQRIIDEALRKQRASQTLIVPKPSAVLPLANLKSWDNWRAFVHSITPIIMGMFVTMDVMTENQATLWIPLIFAIADPVLSVGNTTDKLRRTVYTVLGVLQTGGLVASFFVGHESYLPVAAAVITILNALLARFYTPTTTFAPATRIGSAVDDFA